MLFRLKCHYCGVRSNASKGTTEFQCQNCEAWNFFDGKGEVLDAPARVTAAPRSQPVQLKSSQTFAQPSTARSDYVLQDPNEMFCQTCLTNQRICTESLANYLPDEDHPQYEEYERKLPKYREDLERRYPQICKKCGPKVQATIARADRYGLQQNVAKNMRDTMARGGKPNRRQRDDWSRWSMRMILRLLRWTVYASLLVQVAWHAHSLLLVPTMGEAEIVDDDSITSDGLVFEPKIFDCATDALRMRFYKPCLDLWRPAMSRALLASLLLLWYHPGLMLWYHHTIRIESVFGRSQYGSMQMVLLVIRTIAWFSLSNETAASDLTRSQLLAAHGFMIAFLPLVQTYSERAISYDAWRIKGKMMRDPDEADAFGSSAGPERDISPPQASSRPPVRLFERNEKPFPIESLARRSTRPNRNQNLPYQPPPSPPNSQSVSEDEMDFEMDWQPSAKSKMPGAPNSAIYRPRSSRTAEYSHDHGIAQSKGWTPMRNELFGIQSQQSADHRLQTEVAEQERLRQQDLTGRSPFHGFLPPDPMQRRLRGFQVQNQKQEQPLSERSDFYDTMSKSFGSERFATKTPNKIGSLDRTKGAASTTRNRKNVTFDHGFAGGLNLNDDDEDFSPVKTRHRQFKPSGASSGSLNFRESAWKLPDKTEATGLEDLFGGNSFRIGDEPNASSVSVSPATGWPWGKVFLCVLPVIVFAVAWRTEPVRRTMCLWLAGKLEAMGY